MQLIGEIIAIITLVIAMLMFFKEISGSVERYLEVKTKEIELKLSREETTLEEAFERISYKYPIGAEELEKVLDGYVSGEYIEFRFYIQLMNKYNQMTGDD